MTSSPRKRLQLTSETLQRLGVDDLALALGGLAKAKPAQHAPVKPVSGGSCAGFGCGGVSRQCTRALNCGG